MLEDIEECNRDGMNPVYKRAKQWKKERKDSVGVPCDSDKSRVLSVQVKRGLKCGECTMKV